MPCLKFNSGRTIGGRHNAAIYPKNRRVKFIVSLVLFAVVAEFAAAQTVPLPRARPAPAADPVSPQQGAPSACRLRLTYEFAIATSVSTLDGPGECAVADAVQLEAVVLPDGDRVAVVPPATLRCDMAEAIVRWVREDVAAAVQELGAPLRSIDNYASYHCRGRNNIVGAQLSEHGRANALDIRSLKLANGRTVGLIDLQVARDFRETLRRSACARFSTVLGPGSDGFHENHVHVDLQERARGRYPMCRWDVRDPERSVTGADAAPPVPLPPSRPKIDAKTGRNL